MELIRNINNNMTRLAVFIMRRERMQSAIWLISILLITLAVPPTFESMYLNDADRMGMALTMENPAMVAMCGPLYGKDNYTIGAMTANEMVLFTIIAVAIMNIFFIVRSTRRDEELGRIEVIRSLPVGRLSVLSASLLSAFIINAVLALLTGVGLTALGIESLDFNGSMLYGVALGISGLFFAALASLLSQLCASSRSAIGYSIAVLGFLYILRAAGDINNEVLALISPLGLILRTQIYVNNYWWPVWVMILITIVVALASFYLNSIRDMDQGFIPAKPGKKSASKLLLSPHGLALKLQKVTIIGWFAGMLILGISYGSIMGDLESFLDSSELLKNMVPDMAGYTITELFMTMLMSVMAMSGTVPVLALMLKLRGEEKSNRTEHIISRAVSKNKLMAAYFIIAAISSIAMLFASAFGLWAASSLVLETPVGLDVLLKSMMVFLPAAWFMLGLAVFLIGVFPKGTGICWAYLGYSFLVVYLGKIMNFPEWFENTSPFGLIPQMPVEEVNLVLLAIMTLAAAALTVIGFIFYRKRDLQG